ncbi:AAA family ATPase [Streptomyces sp. NPDC050211]|uniref:AAA family ATPase n=1 Tax=Streptomyces sp. NPDC050211 TaxID=3154932 RepID=UPI00341E6A29
MVNGSLVRLRLLRGYTQEELSERSGVSVRTIRNLERGLILRPRRSSVDMLLGVLDPDLCRQLQEQLAGDPAVPSSIVAEWMRLVDPGTGTWQGPRAPRTSLIGRESELQQLGNLVTAHQVVVVTGPGGVGKSRICQEVAQSAGHWFADGVAVAEMGRIPAERHLDTSAAAMDLALAAVDEVIRDGQPARRALLVLDNTEHLPETTARLVEHLVTAYPEMHLLVTSRRLPNLHGAVLRETPPLTCEAAVDLLLERLAMVCPMLDLSGERDQLGELCRELDLLPRLVEFAAHRLRTVPLPVLLSHSRARQLLGSADHSLLPHQQTVRASVRWSLELLDERHQSFLARLAGMPELAGLIPGGLRTAALGVGEAEAMDLMAELVDSSLLQVDRGSRYEYRMLRHIQAVLAEQAPALRPEALAFTG